MHRSSLLSSALVLAISAFLAVPASAGVIISEIDYDQAGTDSTEWVELHNPDGTDQSLAGLDLEAINQTCTVLHTTALDAITIPAGGYVVIGNHPCATTAGAFPATNALQNGTGDGVLIRDRNTGGIVDGIEYEDAGSGCVPNATSAADNNTDIDSSIQLCDNVWVYVVGFTPCATNVCPVSVDESSWGQVKGLYR